MEEHRRPAEAERLPGEVVEQYRQPEPGEVVERYTRPLPGRSAPARRHRRRRRRRRGLWVFLVCLTVTLGIAAGTLAWSLLRPRETGGGVGGREEAEPREITIPVYPTGEGARLEVTADHGEALTIQEIYRQVNPSVVTVLAQLEGKASVGTGVIFRSDGYILTNYHVLEGAQSCTVALDTGQTFSARYAAGDAYNDLAVLKVDLTGLPTAVFGDSDQLSVGDSVYAIGNPLGVELRGTLTDGIVSAINRDVWVNGRTLTLIQTNAALNSGNSGGPLINQYGQVVGINTVKMVSEYSNGEGLGFAIPSASAERLVNDLLTFGEVQPEPSFGIMVSIFGTQLDGGLQGIEVVEVTPGGAADRAGIRQGDFILSAAGTPVANSQELLKIRRGLYVGDRITMELWRDGDRLEATLDLTDPVE